MDFGDVGDRLKKARQKQTQPAEAEKPFDADESYRIKGKILGVLLRDARVSAARTVEDCARLLNVSPETIEGWEYGEQVPDLPQLEMLAYYLNVHVSHFWGAQLLSDDGHVNTQQEYMNLRHRMIGALLRQAREEAQMSLDDVAEQTHIEAAQVASYEEGEPVPMHELQSLSSAVNRNVTYFLEHASYVGELLKIREEWKHFTDLDEEIRQFAANPLNLGFIEIAIMFSKMPTDRLRKVAEGLLDITM